MLKADLIHKKFISEILMNGTWDENPRPKYESDGESAHSIFITQAFEKYDISQGELPITTLRPIGYKSGIKEMLWIYQDQTSDLDVLRDKYDIHWWDNWKVQREVGIDNEGNSILIDSTIGQRYGATVGRYGLMDSFLNGLKEDPFGRRHIINLWQMTDLLETDGLAPCAFMVMASVRKVNGEYYLDFSLIQRSSDYLVAGHINMLQYVALQMMVAHHCGYRVGNFARFTQNLHIYSRHREQAKQLLHREGSRIQPKLILNAEGKSFYDITVDDFELVDYQPVRPQLKFDLGV